MSCIYSYNSDIQVVGGTTHLCTGEDGSVHASVSSIDSAPTDWSRRFGRGGAGPHRPAMLQDASPCHPASISTSEKKSIEGYKAITKFSM